MLILYCLRHFDRVLKFPQIQNCRNSDKWNEQSIEVMYFQTFEMKLSYLPLVEMLLLLQAQRQLTFHPICIRKLFCQLQLPQANQTFDWKLFWRHYYHVSPPVHLWWSNIGLQQKYPNPQDWNFKAKEMRSLDFSTYH